MDESGNHPRKPGKITNVIIILDTSRFASYDIERKSIYIYIYQIYNV